MPYISRERRALIVTQPQPQRGANQPLNAGELTWQLTRVVEEYRRLHGDRFQTYADIQAALGSTWGEFKRRVVDPYEDRKLVLNGDVYAPLER